MLKSTCYMVAVVHTGSLGELVPLSYIAGPFASAEPAREIKRRMGEGYGVFQLTGFDDEAPTDQVA